MKVEWSKLIHIATSCLKINNKKTHILHTHTLTYPIKDTLKPQKVKVRNRLISVHAKCLLMPKSKINFVLVQQPNCTCSFPATRYIVSAVSWMACRAQCVGARARASCKIMIIYTRPHIEAATAHPFSATKHHPIRRVRSSFLGCAQQLNRNQIARVCFVFV